MPTRLDGKNVVFGYVIDGVAILDAMERAGDAASGRPMRAVTIVNCGQLK